MGDVPAYVSGVFVATTILTVVLFLWAIERRRLQAGLVLVGAMAVHGVLADRGFYLEPTLPPRFVLGPVPTIVLLLVIVRGDVSLQRLTLLSVVRVPVELVLMWLAHAGEVPDLMTFEGRNFDIVSGLTAPLVGWLAFRGDRVNRPLLIVWHVLALLLLAAIVIQAILSLPGPLQQMGFEQPNRAVIAFPFVWLPAVIVPVVLVSHVRSLLQLVRTPPSSTTS